MSIDSQIRELQTFAEAQRLEVFSILSESRSAKAPGRPVFGDVLRAISRGTVDGVLCWKLDRLARNPVDGAALIWAIDEGKLRAIQTRDREFTNNANDKFWMQLEFGMAKKYVDDLSDNVKRGNRAKLEQGWLPGIPPIGYINDLANKTIVPDPERFGIVRKMFDLALAGSSPVHIRAVANDEWGLRTRQYRRRGAVPLSRTSVYRILSDPFYYGLIIRNGQSYAGAHQPMISKDEFDRIQELLGRPNRAEYHHHDFAFRALIRCGECGATITAQTTVNRHGSRYQYYRCTKRLSGPQCTQKTIRAEVLEAQIQEALERIRIDDDFHAWALANLRTVHEEETAGRQAVDRSLDAAYRSVEKEIEALLGLRLRGLLTDDEYLAKKQTLVAEKVRLRERLQDSEGRASDWLKLAEQALFFANYAQNRFATGTSAEKRAIIVALGSNLILRDRVLRISLQRPFEMIQYGRSAVDWRAVRDGLRTFFTEHPTMIRWPSFCLERRNDKGLPHMDASVPKAARAAQVE